MIFFHFGMDTRANNLYMFAQKNDVDATFKGDGEHVIEGFCSLNDVCNNSMIWIRDSSKLTNNQKVKLEKSSGLLLICPEETAYNLHFGDNHKCSFIITSRPRDVFFSVVDRVCQGICNSTYNRSEDTGCSIILTDKIGENVTIGYNCYIGEEVVIGDNVIIHNQVSIECPTIIGENTTIFSGVKIGTLGYGYYNECGQKKRIPHFMGVIIGKDVDIGANTCIDRGCLTDTVIGDRVKIDNLVHIAHNVQIGNDCMVVAQAMLGGSSSYGEKTYIAPGARIFDQIRVGENVIIGVGAVVKDDVDDGRTVVGIPAREIHR